MISKIMNLKLVVNPTVYILIAPLVISLSLIAGCTFGGGLGSGLPTNLGVYCLRSATRYAPTPGSLAGGPPTQPALPLTEKGCESSLEGLVVQWEFLRTDIPSASPLVANSWDVVDAVTSSGNPSCIFKVYVPSEAVIDKGLGVWQITHKVGDWSVTCPEVVITKCPTNENPTINFWTSHTTIGQEGCIQKEIGIDIVEPGFP
ncbi:MAG: hypothetical protein DHS20C13_00500 [Thermodesulfobacteriota bacterium]|nr:MAG: hypothetical protein DHS20C13_00500 [Thermodesulfobacteriota bacterium]